MDKGPICVVSGTDSEYMIVQICGSDKYSTGSLACVTLKQKIFFWFKFLSISKGYEIQ